MMENRRREQARGDVPRKMYAAFIRGINVGGHSVIKMAALRAVFESLGYRGVKTVLASGNVLFEAPAADATALSRDIGQELTRVLGRDITVIVRPVGDLRALAARRPFGKTDIAAGARPVVTFVTDDMHSNCNSFSIPPAADGLEIISISDGTILSVSYDQYGAGTSQMMGVIEKAFGHKVTTRTWDTIIKILNASEKP